MAGTATMMTMALTGVGLDKPAAPGVLGRNASAGS
jgi:hypothetical protein